MTVSGETNTTAMAQSLLWHDDILDAGERQHTSTNHMIGEIVTVSDFEEETSEEGAMTTVRNVTTYLSDWSWHPLIWPWWRILQAISAALGIIGNLLVIMVLFQRRKMCRSTDTLIGALALADFITSVFIIPIPQAKVIPNTWLGQLYCKVVYPSLFFLVAVTASAYSLMAISVERYIAVIYPFYFNRLLNRRGVCICIVFVWLASFLSVVDIYFFYIVDDRNNICTSEFISPESQAIIGYYALLIRMIPALTMLITQMLIARELYRQSVRFQGQTNRSNDSFHLVARNRVLKMMFIVIVIYIVCWSPAHIAYLCFNIGVIPKSYYLSPLHRMLTVLGFYNSCANPIIYTARHPEFRAAIKEIFTCITPRENRLFVQKIETSFRSVGHDKDLTSNIA